MRDHAVNFVIGRGDAGVVIVVGSSWYTIASVSPFLLKVFAY